jgi:gliding motility-associated-like protein
MDPNGDKKKWRYTLWDMDNTFDHGTNYTGIPTMSVNADPCDPSSLSDPGGQGHIPIWNELITNTDFFDDYVNRWQDLATGDLSCVKMISILDSMITVIEPEMPRQIARWGGNYPTWQSNVQDMRDFILARCSIMNDGFLPCYPALSGPFNINVEIIGIGEVEMSDNNIINDVNTPQSYSRFGGVSLPFEVKSGAFDRWEVISTNTYTFDPNVDTLAINLQGDITVKAYFIPPAPNRDIVYTTSDNTTLTTITANGNLINVFPSTISYTINEPVTVFSNIDPDYQFYSWQSDSVTILPAMNIPNISFNASNHDTITLNISKKPTITYIIDPPTTSSSITIDGVNTAVFPITINYPNSQSVTLSANIDPLYGFETWHADSVTLLPNAIDPSVSFSASNNATVTLRLYKKPTITYDVDPVGTTTAININGNIITTFPYSETVFKDDLNAINAIVDPSFTFSSWKTDSNALLNGFAINNSFYGKYNDNILLTVAQMSAFISGDITVCSNSDQDAQVKVSFNYGTPPYSFVYAVDGVNQATIVTDDNPYYISTNTSGTYTLTYFADAISNGIINGSAQVTILESPIAKFSSDIDTISILDKNIKLQDLSKGNINSWNWSFGDGTTNSSEQNPYHSYESSPEGVYQIDLIVNDDQGCSDTTEKLIWISDSYWMYIPNAFTPNDDQKNDFFCLKYNGVIEETFFFKIYDRFTNLVFETTDITELECLLDDQHGWDGKDYETGKKLPLGLYLYQVYYQDFRGWKHDDVGELFIIR